MVERLGTGIRGLDIMLRGGVPKGSMTLLVGPPGAGKTTMGIQFLFEGLLHGRPSFEVLTSAWESLRLIAEGFEWDISMLERMSLVDLFSWRTGGGSKFQYSADPRNPTDVSIAFSKALETGMVSPGSSARLVIDSLSDMMINVRNGGVMTTFLQIIKQKLAALGVTSIVLLEEGVHDQQTVSQVESVCDGTVVLRLDQEARQLMVRRMVATPVQPRWMPYEILSGIDIRAEAFFR